MGTVINALQSISAYPIPAAVFYEAVAENGISSDAEATSEMRNSSAFKRAKAHVYMFLAEAPNISQGGVSFSFTSKEKELFSRKASELVAEANGDIDGSGYYGWMGENF